MQRRDPRPTRSEQEQRSITIVWFRIDRSETNQRERISFWLISNDLNRLERRFDHLCSSSISAICFNLSWIDSHISSFSSLETSSELFSFNRAETLFVLLLLSILFVLISLILLLFICRLKETKFWFALLQPPQQQPTVCSSFSRTTIVFIWFVCCRNQTVRVLLVLLLFNVDPHHLHRCHKMSWCFTISSNRNDRCVFANDNDDYLFNLSP